MVYNYLRTLESIDHSGGGKVNREEKVRGMISGFPNPGLNCTR